MVTITRVFSGPEAVREYRAIPLVDKLIKDGGFEREVATAISDWVDSGLYSCKFDYLANPDISRYVLTMSVDYPL